MALHTFDVDLFRLQFPAFANPITFPDARLQSDWNMAVCYINPNDFCYLKGDCLQLALNQMTAHLAESSVLIGEGQNPGFIQAASIDKVSVTLQAPPDKSQWGTWLASTPYGQQLWALLQAKSVGGYYVGGVPETSAFRRVGGIYQ
jgi:hypothetical protein